MSATAAARNAPARPAAQSAAQEAPGLLGQLLRLAFWLLLSLLFSILGEWIGMTWWWPEAGAGHSRDMLTTELGYLSGDLRETILVSDTAAYAQRFADTAYEWLWQRSGLEAAAQWAAATPPLSASALQTGIHTAYVSFSVYVVAAATITQMFAVRVAVLTLSMPVFALAALVGLLDGLVQRDLRRWGGGRESSFLYHHARRLIWPLFLIAWVLYLSLPFSVHPGLAVLPFAAGVGLLVAITTGSFKKYL